MRSFSFGRVAPPMAYQRQALFFGMDPTAKTPQPSLWTVE
jgi:hypothetical protein